MLGLVFVFFPLFILIPRHYCLGGITYQYMFWLRAQKSSRHGVCTRKKDKDSYVCLYIFGWSLQLAHLLSCLFLLRSVSFSKVSAVLKFSGIKLSYHQVSHPCMFGDLMSHYVWLLVGGLEHVFPYIGNNHPNWLFVFRGVGIPPIRLHPMISSFSLHVSLKKATMETSRSPWTPTLHLSVEWKTQWRGKALKPWEKL